MERSAPIVFNSRSTSVDGPRFCRRHRLVKSSPRGTEGPGCECNGGRFQDTGTPYDPGILLPVYNEVAIHYGTDDF